MYHASLIDSLLDLFEYVALLQGGLSLPVEIDAAVPGVARHVDHVREAFLLLGRVGQGRRAVHNTRRRHLHKIRYSCKRGFNSFVDFIFVRRVHSMM